MFFVVLWCLGYLVSTSVAQGSYLFFSFVALLDIVLVAIVFKTDIPLT